MTASSRERDARVPSGAPAPATLDHDALERYVERLFASEDQRLRAVREAADRAGMPRIQLPPVTARAVAVLLVASRARRVLEVGALGGYSALWIARALPSDGELTTLEIDPDRARVARRSLASAGVGERVRVLVGDAAESMGRMDARSFDAVVLDADKERYSAYLEEAARLLRPDGLLLADNAFWSGRVLEADADETGAAIDRFNRRVAADPRFSATILPVGDGLLVAARHRPPKVAGSSPSSA